MNTYNYTINPFNLDRLTKEIKDSSITIALDSITALGSSVDINFKVELSTEEESTLDGLVENHDGTALPNSSSIQEVVTQFEKEDKVLKLFCASIATSGGTAILSVKVPGTFASGEGRYIAGGKAWFGSGVLNDKITKVEVVDVDNILGYGANTVLRSWHDDEADSENQGWYFPPTNPILEVDSIGGYGFINSELYLRITAKKATSLLSDTFYLNLFWAKQEE